MTIQRWFLVLSLGFGLLLIFVTPPFQSPDEYNHFHRAMGISRGDFIAKKIPKEDITKVYDNFPGTNAEASEYFVGSYIPKENSQDLVFANYPNTALYSPIPYIPATFGILLGQAINANYLTIFYLARVFTLITYSALIFLALKISPHLKNTIFLLALMPMSIFLGMSVSADSMVIALALLVFALTATLSERFNTKEFYALVLASFLLGASKSAYFLLPMTSLVLFCKYRKPKILLPALASITGLVIWGVLSKGLYIPLRNGVNPTEQVSYIFGNTPEFIRTLLNTSIGNRNYIINQFFGNLGWLDIPLNLGLSYFYIVFLAFSALTEVKSLPKGLRITNFLISTFTGGIISVMMYLSWTPVGHLEILGLVGKNFIPVAIFGLAILNFNTNFMQKEKLQIFSKFLPIPILFYTALKIFWKFN